MVLNRMQKRTLMVALVGSVVTAAITYTLPTLTGKVSPATAMVISLAQSETNAAGSEPLTQLRAEHVMIATSDYDGTLAWYQDKLGFRIKHEWTVPEFPNLQLAYLEKNGFIVEVVASPDTPKLKAPENIMARLQQPGIGHFAFLVDDVDAVTAALEAKGVKVVVPPTSFPDSGRRLSFVEDNNGNMIEFLKELPLGERKPYTGDQK